MKRFSVLFRLVSPLFFLTVVILLSLALFSRPTYAQSNANPYLAPNTEANVPANLHTYSQSILIEAIDAISCTVTGVDFLNKGGNCLNVNPQTGKLGYSKPGGGLLPIMGHMIAILYIPSVHSTDYVRYISQNFISNKKAYAAVNTGLGFQGLSPILDVWVAFRNIVYVLFVVVFILLGLGIMLRIRVDAKTALSIQNALPKVIIGILLVTFSFAIAGFLIDLMYLGTYVVVEVMQTADPSTNGGLNGIDPNSIFKTLNNTPMGFTDQLYQGSDYTDPNGSPVTNSGIWGITGATTYGVFQVVDSTIKQIVSNNNFLAVLIGLFNPGCWKFGGAFNLVPDFPNTDWGQCAGELVGYVAYIFIWLVLYFALLSALFRLWWDMLKAYVLILINTAIAPFYIAAGVFPGASMGFGTWMRGMISNLLLFPAALFMFLLAKVFMDKLTVVGGTNGGSFFIPPLMGDVTSPDPQFAVNGQGVSYIGYLIGFGIILLTPTVLEQVRGMLKYQPNKYTGPALTTALAAGAASTGILANRTSNALFREANSKTGTSQGIGRTAILGGPDSQRSAFIRRVQGKLGIATTYNPKK